MTVRVKKIKIKLKKCLQSTKPRNFQFLFNDQQTSKKSVSDGKKIHSLRE